ncbi:hypothetical protein QTP86_033700 [Hemibagrus guttatus]|nr:hypothetical protein QTP86_033700 [Hemibagrus guttatus]
MKILLLFSNDLLHNTADHLTMITLLRKLTDNGKASKAGVAVGDAVISIGDLKTEELNHLEAQSKIKECKGNLKLTLQRYTHMLKEMISCATCHSNIHMDGRTKVSQQNIYQSRTLPPPARLLPIVHPGAMCSPGLGQVETSVGVGMGSAEASVEEWRCGQMMV